MNANTITVNQLAELAREAKAHWKYLDQTHWLADTGELGPNKVAIRIAEEMEGHRIRVEKILGESKS